jgi:hypothetical protein
MFFTSSAKYVITLLIGAQQSIILLPLTNITANPYCAVFNVPTDAQNAVCLYKYGVNAIPMFIYFLLATGGGAFITMMAGFLLLILCLFLVNKVITFIFKYYYL